MATKRRHRRSFGAIRALPSGRFQARYLGPDGITRTAPTTFPTRYDAEKWLATAEADIHREHWRAPERGDILIGEYLAGWLDTRHDLAPRTLELYRRLAARWITTAPPGAGPALATVQLRHLTPMKVRQWHSAVTRAAGRTPPPRPVSRGQAVRAWALSHGLDVAATGRLSPVHLEQWTAAGEPYPDPTPGAASTGQTTAAQAYRLLRAVLNTAVRDELILANPCNVPGAGTVKPRERVPATPAQVQLLAAAVPARWSAAVLVAAWSGLRAGEQFALRRQDVDLDAGALRVSRALVELAGQPITYGPPKSEAGRRTVHLPASVVAALATHMATYTGEGPEALVFPRADGKPMPRTRRSEMFARACRAIGRPDLRWHDLRHTGATLAAHAGASLAELQRRFGHSTVQAALIYQHAGAERDREIARGLDELAAPDPTVTPLRRHTQ